MIDAAGYHFYGAFVAIFAVGLYTLLDSEHLVKKVIGLNLVQVSVFLVFVSAGYVDGAVPPLLALDGPHANPLSHVIVLTAIVVGVSLTAVALALVVRLYDEFGTVDVHEIEAKIAADERGGEHDDE